MTAHAPFLLKPTSVGSCYSKVRGLKTAMFSRKVLRMPSRLVENAKPWLLLSQPLRGTLWNPRLYPTRSSESPRPQLKLRPISLAHHAGLLPALLPPCSPWASANMPPLRGAFHTDTLLLPWSRSKF